MITLKKCPFCGMSRGMYSPYYPFDGYQNEEISHRIICSHCGAAIHGVSKKDAENKWNRRAPRPDITLDACVVITAYTGVSMLKGRDFDLLYEYLYKLFGRPVWTHEIPSLSDEIRKRSETDFIKLCADARAFAEEDE